MTIIEGLGSAGVPAHLAQQSLVARLRLAFLAASPQEFDCAGKAGARTGIVTWSNSADPPRSAWRFGPEAYQIRDIDGEKRGGVEREA